MDTLPPTHRRFQFLGIQQSSSTERYGVNAQSYADLHQWSCTEREQFWQAIWQFCGVIGTAGDVILINRDRMPGARWFPEARLNFAENLLRRRDDTIALVFWGEEQLKSQCQLARVARRSVAPCAGVARTGRDSRATAWQPTCPTCRVR